jgi:DNA-binding transcriptional ArsR family regulator
MPLDGVPDGGRVERHWERGDDELSLDFILELLSHYQRREIIRHLRDSPGQLHSLDEIVSHLSQLEREQTGAVPGEDHLLAVIVHIHGPKLQEAGLCDYDIRSRELRYMPNEAVERVLDMLDELAEDL